MKRMWAFLMTLGVGSTAFAALDVGEAAPDFTTSAAVAGKVYNYSLKESLVKGPVVLFFFPAAFSTGCSIEPPSASRPRCWARSRRRSSARSST